MAARGPVQRDVLGARRNREPTTAKSGTAYTVPCAVQKESDGQCG